MLYSTSCTATDLNEISIPLVEDKIYQAKFRYRDNDHPVKVKSMIIILKLFSKNQSGHVRQVKLLYSMIMNYALVEQLLRMLIIMVLNDNTKRSLRLLF